MYPFRKRTPRRRGDVKEYAHYSSHKPTLKEDFNNRCGYCDDSDSIRIRPFAIDHFVPQNPKDEEFKHEIDPTHYPNLVYACSFCNLAKSNKWVTKDPLTYNDGQSGFIDPTTDEYTAFFIRDKNGRIVCNGINVVLSKYIITELKLWYPIHNKTWKFERLDSLLSEIEEKIDNTKDEKLKGELKADHYEILKEFRLLVKGLFAEND